MADSAAQTSHHSFGSWDHKLGISVATFFRSSHLDLFTSLGQESVSGTHISGDSWLGANWSQMTSVWQFYSPPSCLSNPPNRIVLACAHGCNEGAGEDCEIHDSKVQQGSKLQCARTLQAFTGITLANNGVAQEITCLSPVQGVDHQYNHLPLLPNCVPWKLESQQDGTRCSLKESFMAIPIGKMMLNLSRWAIVQITH